MMEECSEGTVVDNSSIPKAAEPARKVFKGQPSNTGTTRCVNCDMIIKRSSQITEIQVGFRLENDEEDNINECSKMFLVDALCSVFSTGSEGNFQNKELRDTGFCLKCAKVASEFYGHFNTLLNFSTPTAPITRSIQQFKNWHLQILPEKLPNGRVEEAENNNTVDIDGGGDVKDPAVLTPTIDKESAGNGEDEHQVIDEKESKHHELPSQNTETQNVDIITEVQPDTTEEGTKEKAKDVPDTIDTESSEHEKNSEKEAPPIRKSARGRTASQKLTAEALLDGSWTASRMSDRVLAKRLKSDAETAEKLQRDEGRRSGSVKTNTSNTPNSLRPRSERTARKTSSQSSISTIETKRAGARRKR